jgi:hypothetical protein
MHEALKLGVRMLWYGNTTIQAEAQVSRLQVHP